MHGRSEGSTSTSCQQSVSKSPSHRTTWHRVASAALPPELRRCSTANSAGQRRVGAALASHGRSHRFDPCHAHQHKRVLGVPMGAVCQQGSAGRRMAVAAVFATGAVEELALIQPLENSWRAAQGVQRSPPPNSGWKLPRPAAANTASSASGPVCPLHLASWTASPGPG
jgi:hypothetical protein